MAKSKRSKIKSSLIDTLERVGKCNDHTLGLVDDYMNLYDIKNLCNAEIKKYGINLPYQNGENQMGTKTNPALTELNRVIRSMDLILRSLGVRPADSSGQDDGCDL